MQENQTGSSERLRKLEKLGIMQQDLVEGDDILEDATQTRLPRDLPLMLMLIIGLALFSAVWIFIIFLGVGEATVTTTLGTHFMR